jgi:hypothetical protein
MKKMFLFIFISFSVSVFANDGGVAMIGGTLVPMNITTVSMDYERLYITLKKDYFEIEAYIELNNHENKKINPLLGFEFHEGWIMNSNRFWESYKFNQFILQVNGEAQKFEYKVRDENTRYPIHTLVYNPGLNPGKNIVYHKFKMPYGFGSSQGSVGYILETSSRWKDGKIKNLEVFIRTEFNTTIQFEEQHSANYEVKNNISSFDTIGQSKLYNKFSHDIGGGHGISENEYYSLTQNGYLYKNLRNFIPDKNIGFQVLDWYSIGQYGMTFDNELTTIHDWTRYMESNTRSGRWYFTRGDENWIPSERMLEEYSIEELRLLRNALYAIRGYVFNDNNLNVYFNKQYWYFPNPNIEINQIILSKEEQRILQYIIAEERRR